MLAVVQDDADEKADDLMTSAAVNSHVCSGMPFSLHFGESVPYYVITETLQQQLARTTGAHKIKPISSNIVDDRRQMKAGG